MLHYFMGVDIVWLTWPHFQTFTGLTCDSKALQLQITRDLSVQFFITVLCINVYCKIVYHYYWTTFERKLRVTSVTAIFIPLTFSESVHQKAPIIHTHTTPAPHHSIFYRPDALPAAKPTVWKHWRQKFCTFRSLTLTLTSTLTGSMSYSTIVNSDINVHVSSSRFCFFVNFHSFIIRASFLVLGSCVHFVFFVVGMNGGITAFNSMKRISLKWPVLC